MTGVKVVFDLVRAARFDTEEFQCQSDHAGANRFPGQDLPSVPHPTIL